MKAFKLIKSEFLERTNAYYKKLLNVYRLT